MRIFVTVGNARQPFDRLLRGLDEALRGRDDVEGMIQHGTSKVRIAQPRLEHRAVLARPEVDAWIARAEVLVTHAGLGSLAAAIRAGHRPIVMPRLGRLGEHVNDHQLELCEELGERGLIQVATDVRQLRRALESGPTRIRAASTRRASGLDRVAEAIESARGRYRGSLLVRGLARLGPSPERLQILAPGSTRDGREPR